MAEKKGHPRGLYQLFFTEMWERLAFYTMLNILLLYVTDAESGGLGLTAAEGNEIYGLYLAFVYFTPFPGGMLADRYLGYRRAVVIGAILMSAGLFMMSIAGSTYFISGLVLLILGNGFFKPNISVMVGNLYEPGDARRDAGFNIFYMGINVGAFVASFLSSYVRGHYGWLWAFRVAAIGLLVGMVILLFNWAVLERADRPPERGEDDAGFGEVAVKILLPALGVGLVGYLIANKYFPGAAVSPGVAGFLAGMVPVIIFFVRLGVTAPVKEKAGLLALLPVYVAGGTFFMVLHLNGSAMTQWARDTTDRDVAFFDGNKLDAYPSYYVNAGEDVKRPDPRSLAVVEGAELSKMYGQQKLDAAAVARIAASDPGLEVREFPVKGAEDDPIAARAAFVFATGVVTVEDAPDGHGGTSVSVSTPDGAKPEKRVAFVRSVDGKEIPAYVVDTEMNTALYDGYRAKYGHDPDLLPPGKFMRVIAPELYQSLNALFVVGFTPLVVWFFGWRIARRREITTARKVYLGLVLTSVALVLMAIAGLFTDGSTVKVSSLWLAGFYAIVTLGELCLSPMGLSLVTKLAPRRLVGLAMGGWFMATAFGNNLSGFFGGIQGSLTPEMFFLVLAAMAGAVALFIRLLLPWLDATLKDYGA